MVAQTIHSQGLLAECSSISHLEVNQLTRNSQIGGALTTLLQRLSDSLTP
jgi:hypothetical protein